MAKIVQTAGKNALGEFAPEFAHFNDDVLFGENWNNEDIDLKTRCIITVVALMSSGVTDSSLKYHLENAKNNGVTARDAVAAGYRHIDTAQAYGNERVVGGPKINTAFLEAGLLDEISLLVGVGIDGRGSMPAVFDGLAMQHDVTKLKLIDVKKFDSDAVRIRYQC